MNRIFSIKWVLGVLTSTFITMCFIYIIKRLNEKVSIPVVSDIVEGV